MLPPIDASFIDKSLPVPVGKQLYGLLSYQLSHGDIERGTRLPSVRRLATAMGIAQATVAQVYQDLRDAGLIEMRQGSGAFTRLAMPQGPAHEATALRTDIERLLGKAERLDVSPMTLVSMVNAQARLRRAMPGLTIVFVGIFEEPAADYVEAIRPLLSRSDRISLLTLSRLHDDPGARAACEAADVVVTFLHREAEVARIVPGANVRGLRFIPAERTRRALASIDPRARVAAITQLQDYIAIMRPSVQKYAPHVAEIRVTWSHAPDLGRADRRIRRRDLRHRRRSRRGHGAPRRALLRVPAFARSGGAGARPRRLSLAAARWGGGRRRGDARRPMTPQSRGGADRRVNNPNRKVDRR